LEDRKRRKRPGLKPRPFAFADLQYLWAIAGASGGSSLRADLLNGARAWPSRFPGHVSA